MSMSNATTVRTVGAVIAVWSLRFAMTGYAALAIGQPFLAGAYLSGSYDAIEVHRLNGGLLMVAAMVAGVLAVAAWFLGRGKAWPVGVILALLVAQVVQLTSGYARTLNIHIPLGVMIVGGITALAVWSWTSSAREPGWFWRRRARHQDQRPTSDPTRVWT